MRDEWKKVTLGEVANLQTGPFGSQLKAEEYVHDGIPIVMPINITSNGTISMEKIVYASEEKSNTLKKHKLESGDIVFSRRGDLSKIGYITVNQSKWLCGTGCLRARPQDHILSSFLYLYLKQKEVTTWLEDNAIGQTMKNVNTDILSKLPVLIPCLEEQEKIAETLSIWDSAIEKTEKLISEKEKLFDGISQRLFRKAKTKHKICEYLSSRNEKCVPDDSIPLYSLTIEDGVTPKSDRYDREALVKDLSEKEYKVVYPGDIVFNPANLRWGAIARSNETRKVAVSPIYEVLNLDSSKINSDYLTFLLTSKDKIGYYATKTEGTLVERMAVKVDVFLNFEIEIEEDREKQKSSAEVLATIKKEISLLKKQLEQYKLQKQGLMQKLLTGEWRVK